MLALLRKIKDSNTTLNGDLEFVNEWVYFSHGVRSLMLVEEHNG